MGAGSWLSKHFQSVTYHFLVAEIILGVLGGLSIPIIYFTYALATDFFIPVYAFTTIGIGFLIGLEVPFLTRMYKTDKMPDNYFSLKNSIANILSLDYLGALLATLIFPFILLPFLGVYQSSILFGLINLGMVLLLLQNSKITLLNPNNHDQLVNHSPTNLLSKQQKRKLYSAVVLCFSLLLLMMLIASTTLKIWDNELYEDRIIYNQQTPYQLLVLTKSQHDVRLFINGNLQFSSIDEHRYHQALVHVPISQSRQTIKRVLLLGAGDGLAVRELLKYPSIEEIVLVELDPAMINLAKTNTYIKKINSNSLESKKVKIVINNAHHYLQKNQQLFDYIIADLPDPNNNDLAILYSKQFYKILAKNLSANGLFVSQATSPYFAKKAFWSIFKTVQNQFPSATPYHVPVPSFGDWGFVYAFKATTKPNSKIRPLNIKLSYLENDLLPTLFHFAKDIRFSEEEKKEIQINSINNPILLNYYLEGWKNYSR